MTSVFRRLLAVLAIALLAASCSSADTLATVGGAEITKDDLSALRPSYQAAELLDSETIRSDLSLLIVMEALVAGARDQFGYEMTEADIAERLANPPARYAGIIAPADQFVDVTEQAIRISAIQTLIRDAVVPALAEEEAAGWENLITQRPEEVTRSCVRHISVSTSEEADDVLARLQNGEDFATLASEVSLDQQSPGGLLATADGNCLVSLVRAGLDFANLAATAPLNTPVGPVVADGEVNILVVEDRLAPASVADLAADPMEWLDPDYTGALFTPWFNDVVTAASIDVSPVVGRWSEAGTGIVPPGE